MECINIRVNNGKVDVTIDGAKLTDVHSVSVDYIKGIPLLFADVSIPSRNEITAITRSWIRLAFVDFFR